MKTHSISTEQVHVHDWRIYRLVHESRTGDVYKCEVCGDQQFRNNAFVGS